MHERSMTKFQFSVPIVIYCLSARLISFPIASDESQCNRMQYRRAYMCTTGCRWGQCWAQRLVECVRCETWETIMQSVMQTECKGERLRALRLCDKKWTKTAIWEPFPKDIRQKQLLKRFLQWIFTFVKRIHWRESVHWIDASLYLVYVMVVMRTMRAMPEWKDCYHWRHSSFGPTFAK